ncbi:hypothetical protein ACJIZ3_001027 [Penstemon smallii]|uniref:Uncharacterized protein n=1 Tax=Penstemon smallii TaxID=265156 RepID=A0ABD3U2D9_9LAMI
MSKFSNIERLLKSTAKASSDKLQFTRLRSTRLQGRNDHESGCSDLGGLYIQETNEFLQGWNRSLLKSNSSARMTFKDFNKLNCIGTHWRVKQPEISSVSRLFIAPIFFGPVYPHHRELEE